MKFITNLKKEYKEYSFFLLYDYPNQSKFEELQAKYKLLKVIGFAISKANFYLLWPIKLICKYKGHKWIDESYGTPETGCVAGTCIRCGYHFHQTLY